MKRYLWYAVAFTVTVMGAFGMAGCSKFDKPEDPITPEPTWNVLTFESVGADQLAGPTSYGANLYSTFGEGQFTSYTDAATGLQFGLTSAYGSYEFWNGGICASRWNDMEAEGYTNQCSVHYSYLENGKGGHNGSNTFGVISGAGPALLTFAQEGVERVIDHCYMTNSTYAYLSMCKGDAYAKKHNLTDGDWFKVTVTGLSKEGETTGTVDFYLSDFRSPLTAKVVSIWTKVDLSSLGAVHQLSFSFDSSDKGEWGLNTPTYCCIDDVAVKVQ